MYGTVVIEKCDTAEEVQTRAVLTAQKRREFFKTEPPIKFYSIGPISPHGITFQELVASAYPASYPQDIHLDIAPSIGQIQREVCKQFNVELAELLSPRRYSSIVIARQVAMALSKKLTIRSFPDIGRQFRKDHTTVLHSWRKLEPAVTAAIAQIGLNVTLREMVEMTSRYATTMNLKVHYKRAKARSA